MTIGELIALLSEQDPGGRVVVWDCSTCRAGDVSCLSLEMDADRGVVVSIDVDRWRP